MVKKEKRLAIGVTKGVEETLEIYCKESKDSLTEIYKIQGALIGTDMVKVGLVDKLMSLCFFCGIFVGKEKPKFIKKFKYEELKDNDEVIVSKNKDKRIENYIG